MVQDAGSRFLVARRDLSDVRVAPDPDAPAQRPLAEGEARLAVATFAFTANNITYAAFGESMQYWQFFPCEDSAWGCVPVWGFAVVSESRAEGLAVGRRVYGYLPMGTHLVVRPGKVAGAGFADTAPHRAALAAVYNQYVFCDADPGYVPAREAIQALLKPLFITSFLIDDFLAEAGFFGAERVLLSSASSKTAYATAFCLARRTQRPRVTGLTSAGRVDFVRSLGCYDEVLAYEDLGRLDGNVPAVYVDFAGSAPLRRAVHERWADRLGHSCAVGGTHWQELGGGGGLPGPKPTLFFAPAQVKRRLAPPPEGWGPAGWQQRSGEAWQAFADRVADASTPWLQVREGRGAAAVEAAYRSVLAGRSDAREGLMFSL